MRVFALVAASAALLGACQPAVEQPAEAPVPMEPTTVAMPPAPTPEPVAAPAVAEPARSAPAAPARAPAPRPSRPVPAPPVDPMAGHDMSTMDHSKMPPAQ